MKTIVKGVAGIFAGALLGIILGIFVGVFFALTRIISHELLGVPL